MGHFYAVWILKLNPQNSDNNDVESIIDNNKKLLNNILTNGLSIFYKQVCKIFKFEQEDIFLGNAIFKLI